MSETEEVKKYCSNKNINILGASGLAPSLIDILFDANLTTRGDTSIFFENSDDYSWTINLYDDNLVGDFYCNLKIILGTRSSSCFILTLLKFMSLACNPWVLSSKVKKFSLKR